MDKYQQDFVKGFFKTDKLPGWQSIATSLVQNGECIVAGDGNLFGVGGINNFIKKEKA